MPAALPPVPRKCHEQMVPHEYFREHETLRSDQSLSRVRPSGLLQIWLLAAKRSTQWT